MNSELKNQITLLRHSCKKHGLAVTVQRRLVYESLLGTRSHPTADQLYETVRLHIPCISRTTVYRILDTLVTIGLVLRLEFAGSAAHYDGYTHPHQHAVCHNCGKVQDWESPQLDHIRKNCVPPEGFLMEDFIITLQGTCKECSLLLNKQVK